jgi:hypothetical protein
MNGNFRQELDELEATDPAQRFFLIRGTKGWG